MIEGRIRVARGCGLCLHGAVIAVQVLDPAIVEACPPADLAVDRIAQLLELPKPALTGKGAR